MGMYSVGMALLVVAGSVGLENETEAEAGVGWRNRDTQLVDFDADMGMLAPDTATPVDEWDSEDTWTDPGVTAAILDGSSLQVRVDIGYKESARSKAEETRRIGRRIADRIAGLTRMWNFGPGEWAPMEPSNCCHS